MENCRIIEATYCRNPGLDSYMVSVKVWPTDLEQRERLAKPLRDASASDVTLGWMVNRIKEQLEEFPSATLRLIRPKARSFLVQSALENPVMFEMDDSMKALILNDTDKAKEMFEPIHQMVAMPDDTEDEENATDR